MTSLKRLPAITLGCALALALLVSGCATSYRPGNQYGGYTDAQVTPDTFRVGFVGNNLTSVKRAHDLTMLRAAEVTKAHNFACFVVIEDNLTLITNRTVTPAQVKLRVLSTASGSEDVYTPAQVDESAKPVSDILIHCFSEKPAGLTSFDADALQQDLRKKYKLKP